MKEWTEAEPSAVNGQPQGAAKEPPEEARGDGWEHPADRAPSGNGAPPDEPDSLKAERIQERRQRGENWECPRDPNAITEEKLADRKEIYGYRFQPIDSATFAKADYRPEWMVKRLLVRYQPVILGGPRKSLKTTIIVDLGVSLGSGNPFLGIFTVYRRLRVAILSGESGEFTLQETALRICAAKGVKLADVDCLWDFRLPQLANLVDLAELKEGLQKAGVNVLILDPLYLALLAGPAAQGLEASNLFDIGPLLMNVARACLEVGVTPILIHHTRKNLSHPYEPVGLEDLSHSGCQEFARQWLLVNRREPYEPGSGSHKLWLSAGGSCGHGGLWAVNVEEGELQDDFSGRRWELVVGKADEANKEAEAQADAEKEKKQREKDKQDDAKVLIAIDKLVKPPKPPVAIVTHIRALCRLNGDRSRRALTRLVDDEIIVETETTIETGKSRKVKKVISGYQRKSQPLLGPNGLTGLTGQTASCPDGPARESDGTTLSLKGELSVHSISLGDSVPSKHSGEQEEDSPGSGTGPYGQGY
jgi:hypothetical protein